MIANFLSQFRVPSHFWIQTLGWTLLHFFWQGTAIVIVYAMLRGFLARSISAQGRYALASLALIAMTLAPPLTFLLMGSGQKSHAAVWTISASAGQRLLAAGGGLWVLGVLAFSIRLFGGWRFTARLRSTAHPAPVEWQQALERIAARVGALQSVRLLVSSLVDVPTVIGWLRPVILVPVEFLAGMPAGHITALLLHELAHVRRRDYLASILQSVAEAVLFYHPGVWWISQQMRAERELCCDDLAVAATGDVLEYARALAALESKQSVRLTPVLAANGGSLVTRIRRLIEPAHPVANNLPGPAAAWAMTLLWIAGAGVAAVHAAPTRTVPTLADLSPLPVSAPGVTGLAMPALAGTVAGTLVDHARNTLLFDLVLSAQLAQPPSETVRNVQEALLRKDLLTPWSKWINEDVAYIITDEERNAWNGLGTDEEREVFVEQFWLRRDPTPDTIKNEYKEEHYRRIAYANEHFASYIPGWKTDRGRIYIEHGPPDEIEAHPFRVDWRYRHIDNIGDNINFHFSDPLKNGEYRIYQAMDPDRVNQFEKLQAPPAPEFRDLDGVATRITYNILPMLVRVDYMKVTGTSTMTNVTVQFANRDLQFQSSDGGKARVNLFGRISTMSRRPVTTFEKGLETTPAQEQTVYQQSVPLAPGRYRLNIAAKDVGSGSMNSYEVALDVPGFDEDKLTASSLILADAIERLPLKNPSDDPMFAIGDMKVRPRIAPRFRTEERMGIYLQIYNFAADDKTHMPSGSIEYEIDKAGSDEKVMAFSEEIAKIPNASASQVTIGKMLPLANFQPGAYTLKTTATDRIGNQTVQRQANFSVSPE